jgi:hypothetical protein
MSSLGAQRIQTVELHLPRYGTAWAKVATQNGTVSPGPALLTIGNLPHVGTVIDGQSGINGPSAWVGIWRNGTAWDTVLPPRPAYQNDAGIKLSTILTDLAKDCGRAVIVQPPDAIVGAYWVRASRAADGRPRTGRDELAALIRARILPAWWVDPLDVTRFGVRVAPPVTAATRILGRDLTRGLREGGTESPLAFMPGASFEGQVIERVIIRESSGKLSVEPWTS